VDNLRREHGIVVGIVGQVMEHMVVEVPEELVEGTHVLYGGVEKYTVEEEQEKMHQ